VSPSDVRVQFDNPNWSASVTDVRWNEGGAGTYFKLGCAPNSAACMKQAGAAGTYSYVLMPEGVAAPSKDGQHAYTWDVRPPGDLAVDQIVMTTPEPSTLPLLALGLAALLFVARKKLASNVS
jgi:PEP-CTERM motif